MEDRKYRLAFVNKVSGEAIPDDEPVFVFRARDTKALATLRFYKSRCEDEHHRQAIQETIELFEVFWSQHPDRMKEPGITHQFTHADSPVLDADVSQAKRDLDLVEMHSMHAGYWTEKHGRKLLDKITHQKSRMSVLFAALRKMESIFRGYAKHHAAKPDPEKAARNEEYAEICRHSRGGE